MTARGFLMDLTRRGVVITAQEGRLIVDGPQGALSDEVVARLGRLKSELLGLLAGSSASTPWDAEDWVAYFDERAATREIDGELDRENAVRLAMEDTVTQWISLHPAPPSDVRRGCVRCGQPETPSDPLLPVLASDYGHAWVHDRCHGAWLNARRAEARQTLRALGLRDELASAGVVADRNHEP